MAVFDLQHNEETKQEDNIKQNSPESHDKNNAEGLVKPFVFKGDENIFFGDEDQDEPHLGGRIPILSYLKPDPFKTSVESTASPTHLTTGVIKEPVSETDDMNSMNFHRKSVETQIKELNKELSP